MSDAFTRNPVAHVVGLALVHFLWQGAVLGLMTALMLAVLRRATAGTRYLVACFGLVAMTMTPILTMVAMADGPDAARAVAHGVPLTSASATDAATPTLAAVTIQPLAPHASTTWRERLDALLPSITLLWSTVVLALTLRLLRGWLIVERVRRNATTAIGEGRLAAASRIAARLGIRRRFRINESDDVDVPTVVGWLRPVILVPASALTQLSPTQLEAIIAHELAHIRRHDYVVNGLQNLVETLFFYHPAVWWLSAQVRLEREHCCDDLAVGVCGDRVSYARALATLEESRQQTLAFGLRATGGALLPRIQRLLGSRSTSGRRPALSLVLCAVIVISAGFLGNHVETAPAQNAEPTASTHSVSLPVVVTHVLPEVTIAQRAAGSRDQAPFAQAVSEPRPVQGDRPTSSHASDEASLSEQLKTLEGRLADLHTRLAPDHPDMVRMNTAIAGLRARLDALAGLTSRMPASTAALLVEQGRRDYVQLSDTYRQLAQLEGQLQALRSAMSALPRQAAVGNEGTPQMTELPSTAVLPVGGSIREPRKSRDVPAIYPPAALAAHVQGLVILDVVIDRAGNVVNAVVRRSVPVFDKAALAAVRQWKYEPTLLNGTPVSVAMTVTVNFAAGGTTSIRTTPDPSGALLPPLPAGVLRVGGEIREPRKIVDVPPIYPAIARAAKMQGLVILETTIDREGNVVNAEILRSVPMLDQAALDAVRQWKYEPTLLNGQPVAVAMTTTVDFFLPAASEARVLAAGTGSGTTGDALVQIPAACQVTQPANPAFVPPYPAREPFAETQWVGTAGLWTLVPRGSIWRGVGVRADGKMHKTFWWRPSYDPAVEPHPALSVTARRLDAPSKPPIVWTDATNASNADFGGATMLTGVTLPEAGCWEITGRYRAETVTYTVWAVP